MSSVMFDFKSQPAQAGDKTAVSGPVITYTAVNCTNKTADADHPLMVLARDAETEERLSGVPEYITGRFLNPGRRTAFRFTLDQKEITADILRLDTRFADLLTWLGENGILVRLSGSRTEQGYAVYRIREVDSTGSDKLSAEDGFLQFVIGRILESEIQEEDETTRDDDAMRLTSMQSITDFLASASGTLPPNIRSWARRNLAVAKSTEVSPEERRHAQHALSIMLNIQWKSTYFEPIDPEEARKILDEELYGMASVKQRIIETIIQINRTHTLPAYGLLLCGPAGTGKSQVAYAVARILRLPWTSLDMSSIHDPEALTGSSRVYANAKPGSIMEAFSVAGQSNLVFIINELDKAETASSGGNPADALLTLLDGFGFTDNYMECTIPTGGVYPIATANDKSRISEPLMTRFAVIDIPDYTHEEKKVIFSRFALPKVLRRMGMKPSECIVSDAAVDAVVDRFADQPGVRDLEQAAEHLAANALYQIETRHVAGVSFDADQTRLILNE